MKYQTNLSGNFYPALWLPQIKRVTPLLMPSRVMGALKIRLSTGLNSGNYGRGGFGYRVHIKEVDRDSPELQSFISKELERLGFPDVHVVTEW